MQKVTTLQLINNSSDDILSEFECEYAISCGIIDEDGEECRQCWQKNQDMEMELWEDDWFDEEEL